MKIRYLKRYNSVQNVYNIFLFIFLTVTYSHGFQYGKNTEVTLCDAQCEALCMDKVPNCEGLCQKANRTWVASCDGPNCPGTCSVLLNRYNYQINNLVPTPTPHIYHFDDTSFELSWDAPPVTPLITIFVIERKTIGPLNTSTVKLIDWTISTKSKIDRKDVCDNSSYRVIAVNQFGAMGFSNYIKVPGLQGRIENLKFSGQGVYYSKNMSLFMAILEWTLPTGWTDADVGHYDINPAVKTYCKDMNHLSLPTVRQMQNHTNQARRVLMTISVASVGCVYTPEIRMVSRCGVYGPWTNITVDLNCSLIAGYNCKPKPFDPPGNAENVTLAVSPSNPPSPFAVDLHICWEPPSDLGSMGKIDKYVIRTGKAEQLIPPLPASFVGQPVVRNVSEDIRELIFQLKTEPSPFTYGVQVIPYAPHQYMSENDMGILPVKMIHVGHNDSMALFRKQGTVLYDSNQTVIVYMNKTLPVHFMFDTGRSKNGNSSINKYAIQWGPLVGPNQLFIENQTVLPLNQSELSIYLKMSKREYGLKVKYLSLTDDEPSDTDWDNVPVMSFQLPDYKEEVPKEKRPAEESFNLVPVYILGPVIFLLIIIIVFLRLGIKHQHFKNLEQRLTEIEEEVDENGEIDHYYIMRAQESCPDFSPTVVPDSWELPHTCLKIGRTLGSGAFGQVVRGRISRSLLVHRGINLHGAEGKKGLFVTVAVKMLQEYTEDRYREDFLKEIQMMKDIGYHRNIVSILGCCTLREPFCLIVEHVPYGDLLTYLRRIRHRLQEKEDDNGHYVNQEVELFSPLDLLSVARQITLGMEYLSQRGYVHRDLAARNILVGKNKSVKIGDFGLARYIYYDVGKVYVNRRGGKLPLKWMSVEAIFDLVFSNASDVWAFGVVLFEIVTLGGSPYPLLSNTDLLQKLKNGYRMERPENCSDEIYNIMLWCWRTKPSDRPTFTQLQEIFTTMLQRDSGQDYFNFDINEEHEYYKINPDEFEKDEDLENTVKMLSETNKTSTDYEETDRTKEDELGYLVPKMLRKFSNQANACEADESEIDKTKDGLKQTDQENTYSSSSKPIDIPKHETVSDSSSLSYFTRRGKLSELDRLSNSSDEVFTECPGCLKLNGSPERIRVCPQCRKTRIELSLFDLHSPDRNDSAISSATSDELQSDDDGQSPNTPVSSLQSNADKKTLQDYDLTGKPTVRKESATKYYDELSIFKLIQKQPTYEKHLQYETMANTKCADLKTGGFANATVPVEPTPYYCSRYRLFSDPYLDSYPNLGRRESWTLSETRM